MSATVESDKISSFFGGCPVIHVPGRTFPVDVLYLEDAIEHTGWSISEDSPYAKRREFHATTSNRTKTLLAFLQDIANSTSARTVQIGTSPPWSMKTMIQR
jgi:HrpA-like RNA helicase